jgi:hypothetical protein
VRKLTGAYAHQIRQRLFAETCFETNNLLESFSVTQCSRCCEYAIWLRQDNQMVYPLVGDAPLPHEDLPKEIKEDYLEARTILAQSPRGAAALLRLVIDKLCDHLKAGGDNLNEKIKNLVTKGLPEKVQKALDIVRVTGNNAVHPGQIDVDDIDTAKALFDLVNIIVNHMISENKQIESLYDKLPDPDKKQITKRDKK